MNEEKLEIVLKKILKGIRTLVYVREEEITRVFHEKRHQESKIIAEGGEKDEGTKDKN